MNSLALRAYKHDWYQKNKRRILLKASSYRKKHRRERLIYLRNYRSIPSHKSEATKYAKKYRKAHKKYLHAQQKRWRRNNRERVNATIMERYYKNDKMKLYIRSWQRKNSDRVSLYRKKYLARHRKERLEYLKEYHQRPYVKFWARTRFQLKIVKSLKEIVEKWRKLNGICYLCKKYVRKDEISPDHVVPRWVGGGNEISNIMPTHIKCNLKKGRSLRFMGA